MTPFDGEDGVGPGTDADGVVRAEYDWSSLAPSMAVIQTVATAANREPRALEPLHNTVDSDALDGLLDPRGPHSTAGLTSVSFEFAGHVVTVQNDGVVVVRPGASRHESG